MIILSTGEESKLGNYKKLSAIFFGEDSGAVAFLNKKILASQNGEHEEVVISEDQMVLLICNMHGSFKE